MATLKIKKGDTVFVLAGNSKDNKPHRVLEILPEQGKAIVEGVNIVSKSTKPNAKAPQGGIIKRSPMPRPPRAALSRRKPPST